VQQRGRERRERHDAEQHEGAAGHEEAVERVGGVDGGEGNRRTSRREDARHVRGRDVRERKREFAPARPFAGRDQEGGEQAAEEHAHLWADQSGFDRILHQEDAAEREREPGDPDHPARAEALLETFRRLGRFDGRNRWCAEGLGRLIDARGRRGGGKNLERGGGRRLWRGLGRRRLGHGRVRTRRGPPVEQRHMVLEQGNAPAHAQDQDDGDNRHDGGNEIHFDPLRRAPSAMRNRPARARHLSLRT
jgi:hypothetical protein